MDRDTILNLSIKVYLNKENLTTNEINDVISSYCKEMGKKYADIQLLLYALYQAPGHLNIYFTEALSYYEKKFNICKLESAIINNPYINQEQRKLLLIF